jgi:amylosucrase
MPWPLPPDEHGIQAGVRRLVRARAGLPHLHASVAADILEPPDPGVLLVGRRHPLGTMLGAYNVTADPRHVPQWVLRDVGLEAGSLVDHLSVGSPAVRDEAVPLAPYAAAWLTVRRGGESGH